MKTEYNRDIEVKDNMKKAEWIDLTHKISDQTLVYPGDPFVKITPLSKETDDFCIQELKTAMHVGTHMDSPKHFQSGQSIDELDFTKLMGKASVIHLEAKDGVIYSKDIEDSYKSRKHQYSILLLDTLHSSLFNQKEYYSEVPCFEPSLIDFLLANRIHLLGLDLPTIKYLKEDFTAAHRDLLGNNIIIVEGLNNLSLLSENVDYIGLPLNIEGMDGSLIRAVAKNRR